MSSHRDHCCGNDHRFLFAIGLNDDKDRLFLTDTLVHKDCGCVNQEPRFANQVFTKKELEKLPRRPQVRKRQKRKFFKFISEKGIGYGLVPLFDGKQWHTVPLLKDLSSLENLLDRVMLMHEDCLSMNDFIVLDKALVLLESDTDQLHSPTNTQTMKNRRRRERQKARKQRPPIVDKCEGKNQQLPRMIEDCRNDPMFGFKMSKLL
jgi:hypothetical protein